ncbi:MAG: hypothetical protein WKF30_10480 [Pyrinomonadaceae bacterium]
MKAEVELINSCMMGMEKKSQKYRRRYENVEQYNSSLSIVYIASN